MSFSLARDGTYMWGSGLKLDMLVHVQGISWVSAPGTKLVGN